MSRDKGAEKGMIKYKPQNVSWLIRKARKSDI